MTQYPGDLKLYGLLKTIIINNNKNYYNSRFKNDYKISNSSFNFIDSLMITYKKMGKKYCEEDNFEDDFEDGDDEYECNYNYDDVHACTQEHGYPPFDISFEIVNIKTFSISMFVLIKKFPAEINGLIIDNYIKLLIYYDSDVTLDASIETPFVSLEFDFRYQRDYLINICSDIEKLIEKHVKNKKDKREIKNCTRRLQNCIWRI